MPLREVPERFLVAFSFAGEQRDLVRSIAEAVEQRLGFGTVFYDEWFEHYLAGSASDIKLQEIYSEKAELVVVGVSGQYGTKPWTLAECDAVRARNMQLRASPNEREADRILPLRVGDGDVPGILFNTVVPEVRSRPATDTAELIVNRLQRVLPADNSIKKKVIDRPVRTPQPAIVTLRTWLKILVSFLMVFATHLFARHDIAQFLLMFFLLVSGVIILALPTILRHLFPRLQPTLVMRLFTFCACLGAAILVHFDWDRAKSQGLLDARKKYVAEDWEAALRTLTDQRAQRWSLLDPELDRIDAAIKRCEWKVGYSKIEKLIAEGQLDKGADKLEKLGPEPDDPFKE